MVAQPWFTPILQLYNPFQVPAGRKITTRHFGQLKKEDAIKEPYYFHNSTWCHRVIGKPRSSTFSCRWDCPLDISAFPEKTNSLPATDKFPNFARKACKSCFLEEPETLLHSSYTRHPVPDNDKKRRRKGHNIKERWRKYVKELQGMNNTSINDMLLQFKKYVNHLREKRPRIFSVETLLSSLSL